MVMLRIADHLIQQERRLLRILLSGVAPVIIGCIAVSAFMKRDWLPRILLAAFGMFFVSVGYGLYRQARFLSELRCPRCKEKRVLLYAASTYFDGVFRKPLRCKKCEVIIPTDVKGSLTANSMTEKID